MCQTHLNPHIKITHQSEIWTYTTYDLQAAKSSRVFIYFTHKLCVRCVCPLQQPYYHHFNYILYSSAWYKWRVVHQFTTCGRRFFFFLFSRQMFINIHTLIYRVAAAGVKMLPYTYTYDIWGWWNYKEVKFKSASVAYICWLLV